MKGPQPQAPLQSPDLDSADQGSGMSELLSAPSLQNPVACGCLNPALSCGHSPARRPCHRPSRSTPQVSPTKGGPGMDSRADPSWVSLLVPLIKGNYSPRPRFPSGFSSLWGGPWVIAVTRVRTDRNSEPGLFCKSPVPQRSAGQGRPGLECRRERGEGRGDQVGSHHPCTGEPLKAVSAAGGFASVHQASASTRAPWPGASASPWGSGLLLSRWEDRGSGRGL